MDIGAIRKDYRLASLSENEVDKDALVQFNKWWNDAIKSELEEVNAMTLATVDKYGKPSARIVLLKGITEKGFVFFTNYESKKGQNLQQNPNASLVFFWKELERQIRVEGITEKVSDKESDEYFSSRPAISKLGAWASPQSQVIPGRALLENRFKDYEQKFQQQEIPRPKNWGGYVLKPQLIEFWQGRSGRLHDRLQYTFVNEEWKIERLAP